MPHAFLLHLTPTTRVPKHPYLHQYTHGLFYSLLKTIDPVLSAYIHASKRNPFTLWAREEGGGILLRVTLLDDALFRTLLGVVLQESVTGLELGQDSYRVARVLATPEGHRDAGFLGWEAILAAEPVRGLELRFVTPTVFATSRGKKRHYTPLPLPRLVLKSLLRAFQTYSPAPYSEPEAAGLEAMFDEQFVVTGHDIATKPHKAGKVKLTGFVGRASIRYQEASGRVEKALGQLASLAFFSGVGAKTPYGMGQVRLDAKTANPRATQRTGVGP